jgi:hypothetical protein
MRNDDGHLVSLLGRHHSPHRLRPDAAAAEHAWFRAILPSTDRPPAAFAAYEARTSTRR